MPEAGGFQFASRFTADACVAVFDRAFSSLRAFGVDELVRHAGFLDALDDYDIVLTEPPGQRRRVTKLAIAGIARFRNIVGVALRARHAPPAIRSNSVTIWLRIFQ